LGSCLPPFLLHGPPTLVFWFLCLPRCLDPYIGCTVHYSIWNYNFTCGFIWVCNLVAHIEGGT
jgi:hypothetical protein